MTNNELKKYAITVIGFSTIIVAAITFFPIRQNKPETQCDCWGEFEKGKSIGRNAMLVYLGQCGQVDSLKIDLHDLMAIEDSLDAAKTFEPKKSDTIIQLNEK